MVANDRSICVVPPRSGSGNRARHFAPRFDYLNSTMWFLRGIIARLSTNIGPKVLERWFRDAASRAWTQDEAFYSRIKLVTLYVESRIKDLPAITESMYTSDIAAYG